VIRALLPAKTVSGAPKMNPLSASILKVTPGLFVNTCSPNAF